MGSQNTFESGRKVQSDKPRNRVVIKSDQNAVSDQKSVLIEDKPYVHVVYYDKYHYCKVFNARGKEIAKYEMRNDAVGSGTGHDGKCPYGDYKLNHSRNENRPEFGHFFIPVEDIATNGALTRNHRAGIGIHGGGSGLVDPFANRQGWVKTLGCFRMQNEDLLELADYVDHSLDNALPVLFTNKPE